MLYYNYQRDRVTVLADVNSLPRTQKNLKKFQKTLDTQEKKWYNKDKKGGKKNAENTL